MKDKKITYMPKYSDYVFEVNNKDISKMKIEYYIGKSNYEKINNEKKETKEVDYIDICISGENELKQEFWFSFMLELGIDKLNSFPKKIININEYVGNGESFIKYLNDEYAGFLDFYFPTNKDEDIYHNIDNFWILKLEDNIFIFKISIPNEGIFTYFKIDFNN